MTLILGEVNHRAPPGKMSVNHPGVLGLTQATVVKDTDTDFNQGTLSLTEDQWGKTVPVVILTNVGAFEEQTRAIDGNSIPLVKADWSLG